MTLDDVLHGIAAAISAGTVTATLYVLSPWVRRRRVDSEEVS